MDRCARLAYHPPHTKEQRMTDLTLDDANRLIAAALGEGARLGCKPLTVAVLDAAGVLLAFQRQAPSGLARPDVAIGKARAALALGLSSRKVGEMAERRPHFVQGVMAASAGPFIPVAGAVLIAAAGATIGAVGISGDTSDNDEACAVAGIAAIGRAAIV
jgi:uncharacterized protein GlcG (DUF336 family)